MSGQSISTPRRAGRNPATRPAVVVSIDKFNHGPAELIVVLPVTSKDKKQPIHSPVKPPEGGLPMLSFVKCEDIRSVTKQRLKHYYGTISAETMAEVEMRIRILLGL